MSTSTMESLAQEIQKIRERLDQQQESGPFITATISEVDLDTQMVSVELTGADGLNVTTDLDIPAQGNYIPEVGHDILLLMQGSAPVVLPPAEPIVSEAPSEVAGLTVSAGVGGLVVSWTGASDANVKWNRGYYQVQVDTASDFTDDPTITDVAATSAVISGLTGGTTYYVRVRAVNYTGVEGDWSTVEDGVPITISTGAGVEVVTDLPVLPDVDYPDGTVVVLDDDWHLYRNAAGTWTDAVPAVDITGTIGTSQIATDAITAALIAAGAVGASELAAAAVGTAAIQTDAITAALIAAGAVGSSELAAGAVIAGKITAGAIVAADIATGTLTATQIAAATITGAKIAAGTITAANILAGTITASEIAALTIVAGNIAAATITGSKLVAGTITATQIAAGTITATELAANTITAAKIQAGAIGTTELAADAVTAAKIAANAIIAGKIAAGVITATELAANSVTAAKLSAIAIEAGKYVRSTSYVAGVSGWTIEADGTAEFNNVTVRGTIVSALIRGTDGTTNYLPNPNFEGNVTTGWVVAAGGSGTGSITTNTASKRSGTYGLQATATAGGEVIFDTLTGTSGFTVVPGRAYRATGYLKHAAATAGAYVIFYIIFYNSIGTTLGNSGSIYQSLDASFRAVSVSGYAPATAAYCSIRVQAIGIGNAGTLYADDFTVVDSSSIVGGYLSTGEVGARVALVNSQIELYTGRSEELGSGAVSASLTGDGTAGKLQGRIYLMPPYTNGSGASIIDLKSRSADGISSSQIDIWAEKVVMTGQVSWHRGSPYPNVSIPAQPFVQAMHYAWSHLK